MLTWAIVLVATIFMAFSGFFYQKTFSDITNIQKDIQEMKINQVNMQRDIQDIKTLLEKRR